MIDFIVVIPARLKSTRLPNKPLADIGGKPMVVRVAEQAARSGASRVLVAVDDAAVLNACTAHGVEAMMTRVDHPQGTDRIAEVAMTLQLHDDALVVNVQGDEPMIDPALIAAVAQTLAKDVHASIATAAHPITDAAEFFNPNVVKVVTDANARAMLFSRAPIPFARDAFAQDQTTLPAHMMARRHIGIYAYRAGFLRRYTSLKPAPIEQLESLEQLRAMHHGYGISVLDWPHAIAAGVDTPDDLERVRKRFS